MIWGNLELSLCLIAQEERPDNETTQLKTQYLAFPN